MQIGQPSRTAMGAAAHRAVHQTLESGVIFADPFALQILSDEVRAGLSRMAGDPAHRPMRLFVAARSRFSEDTMAAWNYGDSAQIAQERRRMTSVGRRRMPLSDR